MKARFSTIVLAMAALTPANALAMDGGSQGYAEPVTSPAARAEALRVLQVGLRSAGVPSRLLGCKVLDQVAVGVRGGEVSYGGACNVVIGDRPSATVFLCSSDLSGGLGLRVGDIVLTDAAVVRFIRGDCW